MLEYCMKDKGEKHFEFAHHNVSAHDMNEGKMEYAKLARWDWKIMWVLHILVFGKGLTVPIGTLLDEEALGCYHPRHNLSHVQERPILPQSSMLYSIEINGYGCLKGNFSMEDHDDSTWFWHGIHLLQWFIWYHIKGHNMRYFKSQQIAFGHEDEEEATNRVLRKERVVGLDGGGEGSSSALVGGGPARRSGGGAQRKQCSRLNCWCYELTVCCSRVFGPWCLCCEWLCNVR